MVGFISTVTPHLVARRWMRSRSTASNIRPSGDRRVSRTVDDVSSGPGSRGSAAGSELPSILRTTCGYMRMIEDRPWAAIHRSRREESSTIPTRATSPTNRNALTNESRIAIEVDSTGAVHSPDSARSEVTITAKTKVDRNIPIDHRMIASCCSIGTTRTDICEAPNCMARVIAVNTKPVRVIMPPAITASSVAVAPISRSDSSVTDPSPSANSASRITTVIADTIDNETRSIGNRHNGVRRNRRRVRFHRSRESNRLGSFGDDAAVCATGSTAAGISTGTPNRPDSASCKTILARTTGSRSRTSRPQALACFAGLSAYLHRAHGELGRPSLIAPTISSGTTNNPTSPVHSFPLSRVIAASASWTARPPSTSANVPSEPSCW